MSELENARSPKNRFSGEKSSAVSFRGNTNKPEKDEVPIHLFLSPTNSGSTQSSSSLSSTSKEKQLKDPTQETSFSVSKGNSRERKTKVLSLSNRDDEILSSLDHSQGYSGSDSEDYSSTYGKSKKTNAKIKSTLRANKVHDFKSPDENKRTKVIVGGVDSTTKFSQIKISNKDGHSPSVSDLSIDNETKRGNTSQSEVSYRERIRDRFNTMKEKVVESVSRPQSRPQSRLMNFVLKYGGTQKEELLRQEESEVSAAMERHEKIKQRWRAISEASLEKDVKSQEECNKFFIEDQIQEQTPPPLSPSEVELKSPNTESAEIQDDSKILTVELLGFKEDWDLVEYVKPKIANIKNQKLWEEKLFYPSTAPVSLEDKIEPGLAPRRIEEEGLYVGAKIKLPRKIKNKMEQRLLKTPEGRKWFDKDGELISSTCLLKPISMRPSLDDDNSQTSTLLKYVPPTLGHLNHRYIDLSGSLNYVLDIDISSIEFTHHPLFSMEHVLAQRLKELYIKYKKRKEMETLNRLTGRLNALRKTRDNLKNIMNESGDNANLEEKLQEYEDDIKEVRQMRYTEGQIDKQLINKIISTWKDLSKLREDQGFQITPLKLCVKKKTPEDPQEEKNKWDSDIKQEIREIVDELKRQREKAIKEYMEKYETRRSRKKMEKEAEDDYPIERHSDTESANESESEREEFSEKEEKHPSPIIVADVKAQVVENFKESFRRPGEPEIDFVMSKATNLDVSIYNNKEELRKAAVKRCMVFIKLFYNGKEVCRSQPRSLGQNFSVTVGQRFAIRILEWPESLMMEIHEETGTLNKNLLVPGIYLPFPDSFTTVLNSEIEKHEFSSKISQTYHHAAVGSGTEVIPCPNGSDFNNQPVCLYTSGMIACRIGWMDNNGKILAPPEKFWSVKKDEPLTCLSDILKSSSSFNIVKLKEWAENSKLDPNDPYNSAFFYFLENAGDTLKTKPSYFRLNPLLDEFDFCKETDIEDNVRLKLLKLRDMEEPEFRDMKMIPLNEKQIHKEIFKDYEKRLSTPYPLSDILYSDPLDGHRCWGKMYLEQVHQKLLKQCRVSKQNRFQDIITEGSIPDIGQKDLIPHLCTSDYHLCGNELSEIKKKYVNDFRTLGLTFMKWIRPKRPLRPVRKERKKITPRNLSGQEIRLIVNIVRAFEVPVRKDMDTVQNSERIEDFSLVNVRPFVEISFRGVTARTTAAEGSNPTWNQDLQIPLTNKNEFFSSGNLKSIKDTLYIHLFDEIIIDLIEDESVRKTNIHQRLERNWLASMKIPFSTLHFNSRIEGTFKLYSPPVLLGYEREAHRRHFNGSNSQTTSLPQRDATYITLFVTVQPALNPPKPIKEKMDCSEVLQLEKHLEGWLEEVTKMFPHRKVKTLVLDITGKSVCVTRFVKALPLPPIVDEENLTPEMAARFVSMIPSVPESTLFSGFFDIWLTSDQVLRLLCGDSEDHAILLCSYFLCLGLKAYILIGSGIPHGYMAYVLVKEQVEKNIKYFVWDPTNGEKYNIDDSFCPLQKVFCLINDENIWANIQSEEMPRRTRFDLTKRGDWFPAFGKSISAPTESVQPQTLLYKTTSRQAVDILQDKIEKKLRDNLMKWRKRSRTQWNRYCAGTLRRLLPKLEESTWNLGKDRSPDHILELQHILASHKICGFPINMPYTTIEAVTEAVKATGVHFNESEGVEFALAVYIHPYPNDILSVWVYVASLVRRR